MAHIFYLCSDSKTCSHSASSQLFLKLAKSKAFRTKDKPTLNPPLLRRCPHQSWQSLRTSKQHGIVRVRSYLQSIAHIMIRVAESHLLLVSSRSCCSFFDFYSNPERLERFSRREFSFTSHWHWIISTDSLHFYGLSEDINFLAFNSLNVPWCVNWAIGRFLPHTVHYNLSIYYTNRCTISFLSMRANYAVL